MISDRFAEYLGRGPRAEDYNPDLHASDKSDWLADSFFDMTTADIQSFIGFLMIILLLAHNMVYKGKSIKMFLLYSMIQKQHGTITVSQKH